METPQAQRRKRARPCIGRRAALPERTIERLLGAGAPIDAFGVGTKLAVSRDAPDLDMAYRLVGYASKPRLKLSLAKATYPGRKQVFRSYHQGRMDEDVIALWDEKRPGRPLGGEAVASARDGS